MKSLHRYLYVITAATAILLLFVVYALLTADMPR